MAIVLWGSREAGDETGSAAAYEVSRKARRMADGHRRGASWLWRLWFRGAGLWLRPAHVRWAR